MHIQPPTKIEVQGRRIKRKKRTGGGGGFCSLASPQLLLHFSGILTRTRLIVNSGEEEEINAPSSTPFIRTLLFGNFILATWFFFPISLIR